MLIISLLTISSFSFGAITCPTGTQTMKTCVSTPKDGDGKIARAVNSIAICEQGNNSIMVLEKDGDSDNSVAKVEERMGGTTYSFSDGNTMVALSIPTGMRSSKKTVARFTISFPKANVSNSSTFTCK